MPINQLEISSINQIKYYRSDKSGIREYQQLLREFNFLQFDKTFKWSLLIYNHNWLIIHINWCIKKIIQSPF